MATKNTGSFKKGNTPWNKNKRDYKIKYPTGRKLKKHLTKDHIENIKKSAPKSSNHYLWKGDDVSYTALHEWVEKNMGKPKTCQKCKSINSKKYEWANKSGMYKRKTSDWIRLCTKCHRQYDNAKKAEQLKIQAEKL